MKEVKVKFNLIEYYYCCILFPIAGIIFATSVIMGSLNILAGMGSAMSSIAGSMGRVATDVNSKFALRFLAGLIAGGTEAAYDLTSYHFGKLISAF